MKSQFEIERLQSLVDSQKTVIQALQRENAQLTAQLEVYSVQSRKLVDVSNRLQAQSTAALEEQMERMRQIQAHLQEVQELAQGVCTLVDAPNHLVVRASTPPDELRRVLKAALPEILAVITETSRREAPAHSV
jgi:predicted RNase H-like nuclease (RuvC/YqgF family)